MKAKDIALKVQYVEVDENSLGQRIDNFLLSRLKGVPKSRVYRIIRKGEVRVNGKRIKPEYKLRLSDSVRIPPVSIKQTPEQNPSAQLSQILQAGILYEDEDILVINKPSGLAVHRGSGIKMSVIDALRSMYEGQYMELVHRIDKGTSGCLLLARNARALKQLQDAFRERSTQKQYHALVHGIWPKELQQVSAGLQRSQEQRGDRRVYVSQDGKSASTHFQVLAHYKEHSLILAEPQTGRTHQIRVHASFAGFPLCGDEKYSQKEQYKTLAAIGIKRLCLHAASLGFLHPGSGKAMHLSAPYDAGFTRAAAILAAQN